MSDGAAARIAGRMRQMLARVIVGLVNDATKLQALQVQAYGDVIRDQAEHFQHYGLTSVPLPGAEGIGLALGGSTNHLVVINVDDRRYRLKGLAGGEVALYDDQGQSVHLTRAGIVVKGAGRPVLITDTPSITLDAANTVITGNLQVNGASLSHGGTNIGKTHVHGGVTFGGTTTAVPS